VIPIEADAEVECAQSLGSILGVALDARNGGVELSVLWVLVVAAVFAPPGLDELRDHLARADPALIAAAAALQLGSCLAFVAAFR